MNLRPIGGIAIALFALGAAPAPVIELRNANDAKNRIEARAEFDAGTIRLSGEVKLTLVVDAPGPLSVTVPKPLITKPNTWRVRDDGLPVREILANGRERWSQVYHLSPLIAGDPKAALGPLVVRAGNAPDLTIAWDEDRLPSIHVVTAIENPSVDSLRPPTDIEPLPQDPPKPASSTGWLFAVVPVLLIVSAIGILLGRRKKHLATPRDAAWALRELAAANVTADQCALVLRQYLAYRFGLPAEFQTTPELSAALQFGDQMPPDVVSDWQAVLYECDSARFSGTAVSIAGLADRARELVQTEERRVRDDDEKARQAKLK